MELQALKSAIIRVLQVYSQEITEESTFHGDLGADSIDMTQIFSLVEKELGIKLPMTDMDDIVTVKDGLDFIIRSEKTHNGEQ